jgi:hypothetical protein
MNTRKRLNPFGKLKTALTATPIFATNVMQH